MVGLRLRRGGKSRGLEGQVSGGVFQLPISKFNFRAKTSLCLFSLSYPIPVSVSFFFSLSFLQLRIRKAPRNLVCCFSPHPFSFCVLFTFSSRLLLMLRRTKKLSIARSFIFCSSLVIQLAECRVCRPVTHPPFWS